MLATAMFYGLKTDTRSLARGAAPADKAVYLKLLARLDRHKLIEVEQAGLSREYFRAFDRALQAARLYGQVVVADLGMMSWPDLAAEIADLLIRLEDARAALCLGRYGDTLYFSLRTVPLGQDAGLLVQKIVIPSGKAGGHGTMAGGQVPIQGQEVGSLVAEVKWRCLAVMGETNKGVPLLA
jgi:nanoRNase/pAp phosphatase (c-di-AMP/oligoRNAs hydrolase)